MKELIQIEKKIRQRRAELLFPLFRKEAALIIEMDSVRGPQDRRVDYVTQEWAETKLAIMDVLGGFDRQACTIREELGQRLEFAWQAVQMLERFAKITNGLSSEAQALSLEVDVFLQELADKKAEWQANKVTGE